MKSKTSLRSFALVGIIVGILAIYTLRLVDWQILNGADTRQQADSTSASIVTMDAARGEIVDAAGNPWRPIRRGMPSSLSART